ncbi:MAG: PAS domain-containing protein [Pseudomonadota bacterium]|nr:PAS domain-containing protein [Sphingomonas sp.]MDQ3471883.1 PAS domain-containing protein [Pseudomonadota bacterium]
MNTVVSTPADASFRDASEALLRAVLDQSPDCIKILGPDGTVDYMNQNGQCAMEVDDFRTVAGQRWPNLWPEEARAALEGALAKAAQGEPAHLQAECPTAKGNPKWWDVCVTGFKTEGGQTGFVSISRDVTEAVHAQQSAEAVAAEMRHRLGNAYHIVGSLLTSFARGDADKEAFAKEMITRLNALAAAQSMKVGGSDYDLRALIGALVQPYATPTTPIALDGVPACALKQAEVDALSMVMGELCVNSIKHGALSGGGDIAVTGTFDSELLELVWSERSKVAVKNHARRGGQGIEIMQRVLAARNGIIEHSWVANGVDVRVALTRRS